ncbi:MAG: ribonuclease R [Myxococcaceae bacterium]
MLSIEQVSQWLENAKRPMGLRELMRLSGAHPGAQKAVLRLLRDAVRQGVLRQDGKRFLLNRDAPARERGASTQKPEDAAAPPKRMSGGSSGGFWGKLQLRPGGFGFVRLDDDTQDDVFISPNEARRALDGDRVRLRIVSGSQGRPEGRLLEIGDRRREQVVGEYRVRGGQAFVAPLDDSLPSEVTVPKTQLAQPGDVVKVRLGVGRDWVGSDGPFGEVTGSLGRPGHPSQEVLSVVFGQGFSDEFPAATMDEADRIPLQIDAAQVLTGGRRDVRSRPLVTIDGEDARDFDDAVDAEDLPGGGFRMWVAIADVAHYVRENSPLDQEARRRATSVYLPDRVLPMLPERLSAGLCSLRPNEDRLCLVAEMDFDASGQRLRAMLFPGLMCSRARLTYTEVERVLKKDVPDSLSALAPGLERLARLARLLRGRREQRGSLDFDVAETKPVLDENGQPLRMERRERLEAHRLIEECMLAANEAVAEHFVKLGLPSVHRFHGEPDPKKLEAFAELAGAFGFQLRGKRQPSSLELSAFLRELQGHPEQRVLNQLLLRSMMQAIYSVEQRGHFGLAAEHYLHFTSPIRRYPDLLVHRLLWAQWNSKQGGANARPPSVKQLSELAAHCSDQERAAMSVEREVVSFYSTLLMKDRVGETFDGTISGVAEFGVFVELGDLAIDGMVRAERLGTGPQFDRRLHALTFRDGRKLRVGQPMRVRVAAVDVTRRRIDLDPEGVPSQGATSRGPPQKVAKLLAGQRPGRGGRPGGSAQRSQRPKHGSKAKPRGRRS